MAYQAPALCASPNQSPIKHYIYTIMIAGIFLYEFLLNTKPFNTFIPSRHVAEEIDQWNTTG